MQSADLTTGLSPNTVNQDLKYLTENCIKPWLDSCINGSSYHQKCNRVQEDDKRFKIPTRLVDVGDARSDTVRLVVPGEDLLGVQNLEYLILSYCWGQSNEPAKTTRANLAGRRRCIGISRFPQTIKDAIALTRMVGMRYLWVDAICIVQAHAQDNYAVDFRAEAPKMGAYYANAFFMISALSSADSSQGLFAERPAHRYPTASCVVRFDKRTGEYVCMPAPRRSMVEELDAAPLLKRGWCYQERRLARRILHCSRNGLYWQCYGGPARSEFTHLLDNDPTVKGMVYHEGLLQNGHRNSSLGDTLGELWSQYVQAYSPMSLKFESDRLVAIDGLATRLGLMHKDDEYFAGVFRNHLTDGLLWETNKEDGGREKLDRFPSWSWASCRSKLGVSFESNFEKHTKLAACASRGGFPSLRETQDFQDVSKRVLRVNAPLVKIVPDRHRDPDADIIVALGTHFCITRIYDTAQLQRETERDMFILVLWLSRSMIKGIILRLNQEGYERVGHASLYPITGRGSRRVLAFGRA